MFDGEDSIDLEGKVLEPIRLGFNEGRVVVEGVIGGLRCFNDFSDGFGGVWDRKKVAYFLDLCCWEVMDFKVM